MTKAAKHDSDDAAVDPLAIVPVTVAEQAWAKGEYVVPVTGTIPATGTATLTVTVTDLPSNQAALALAMLSLEVSRDQGRVWHCLARAPWVAGTPLVQVFGAYWGGSLIQGRLTVPTPIAACGLTLTAV